MLLWKHLSTSASRVVFMKQFKISSTQYVLIRVILRSFVCRHACTSIFERKSNVLFLEYQQLLCYRWRIYIHSHYLCPPCRFMFFRGSFIFNFQFDLFLNHKNLYFPTIFISVLLHRREKSLLNGNVIIKLSYVQCAASLSSPEF